MFSETTLAAALPFSSTSLISKGGAATHAVPSAKLQIASTIHSGRNHVSAGVVILFRARILLEWLALLLLSSFLACSFLLVPTNLLKVLVSQRRRMKV